MLNMRIFELQNPWRFGKPFFDESGYIPRLIFDRIKHWLDEEDILVLLGARQTGKSTLIYKTIVELLNRQIDSANIFYFNLDNLFIHEFLKDIPSLLDFINEFGIPETRKYVFIDEIQRLENGGLFLKQLYDLHLPLKIIVSGSSTLEIRSKIKESLTGRKKVFEVSPLSIVELNQFEKQIDTNWTLLDLKILTQKHQFYSDHLSALGRHLISFGGYPKVYSRKATDDKIFELQEIYDSYLQKDIINFLKIPDPVAFNKLLLLLAHQVGNIISIQELATSLQIGRNVVQNYLNYIAATYVVHITLPFYTNKRQEVIKSPKIYFLDNGFRNLLVDNFNNIDLRTDKGALVENFVFQEMNKQLPFNTTIKFWRTQNMAEVDFVLSRSDKIIPIEIKSSLVQPLTGKPFVSFINKYKPKYGFILSENYIDSKQIENCQVYFLPYHWFLLMFEQVLYLLD
ncbi:MAG: ATP-binding protein [candidate division KSB1 bacterium]|nr:ATP-binding protein [candidate division KSB1 bacterium]